MHMKIRENNSIFVTGISQIGLLIIIILKIICYRIETCIMQPYDNLW